MADRFVRPKLAPPAPILGRAPVALDAVPWIPDPIRWSEWSSDRFGGPGATVTVDHRPGPPPSAAWDFQRHPRAAARDRIRGRWGTVPAPWPQTMPDRTRSQISGEAPSGVIEVLQVIGP